MNVNLEDGSYNSYTDNFYQNKSSAIDILFVVDNSLSMYEEQTKLASRLDDFLDGLGGSDWQIGITTTDIDGGYYSTNGELLNYVSGDRKFNILRPEVLNVDLLFRFTMQRDETLYCGRRNDRSRCVSQPSADEKPFDAIIEAIDLRDSKNTGFFRQHSDLAFIILSDEDDSGKSSPEDLLATFTDTWGINKRVSIHGLIIKPGDDGCYNDQLTQMESAGWAGYGFEIESAVRRTGGILGSICELDYGNILLDIGANISPSSFALSRDPISIAEVQVTTPGGVLRAVSKDEYNLVGKQIVFRNQLPVGTKIDVIYLAI